MHILSPNSSEYPELLRAIPQPPQSLYIKGRLDCLQQPLISVVGSRKLTGYGDLVLRTFIPKLVKAGLSIVSGLAYGADVRAHEIALQHKGTCIAVLGSGLDVIYPAVHQRIAETIQKEGGCIMSEHPPTMPPLPHHFPQRNRIISGLSRVTLVVQAGEKSGTVSTCNHALEQGREVCVVLADITREEYKGCYTLANQGATIVRSPEEVLQRFALETSYISQLSLKPALTGTVATLYDCISHGVESSVDGLCAVTGLTPAQLRSALSVLELDGYIHFQNSTWRIIS